MSIQIDSLPTSQVIPALIQGNQDLRKEIFTLKESLLKVQRPTLKLVPISDSCFITIEDRTNNPLDGKLVAVNINNRETDVILIRNPNQLQEMLDSVAYLQMEVEDFKREALNLFTPQGNTDQTQDQPVFEGTTQDNLLAVSAPLIDLTVDLETKSELDTLLEGLKADVEGVIAV